MFYNSENLKSYFKEAEKYSLLTKKEEAELGMKMANLREKIKNCHISEKCEKANLEKELKSIEQRFINSNLRLLAKIAKKHSNKEHSWMDLIHEGYSGLETAVRKFDYTRDCKFSTHATWWIEAPIRKKLGKTTKEDSFDEPLKNDKDSTLYDIIGVKSGNDINSIINKISQEETVNRVSKKMKLSKKQKNMLQLHFLANNLDEIGEIMGISGQAAFKIQQKVMKKLEKYPNELLELKEVLSP